MTLAELLGVTRRRLVGAGIAEAGLDARLLVEHLTATSRIDAIARPQQQVSAEAVAAVEDAVARRITGEPVHRILGFREFYGLRLSLSAETLEPRPDTETLVEAVLPLVEAVAARSGRCRILDLGTGTGAIALALLHTVAAASAVGVDISEDALATAVRNAAQLGLSERFTPFKSNWFSEISGRFDVIASNPPYIRSGDIGSLQPEVRDFDPCRALDGGVDGLEAYRTIAAGAAEHLEPGGYVAVEIGAAQKAEVRQVFQANGFVLAEARRDFGANDRVLVFAKP